MKLTSLETGKLKLDGGAMFGVVPKVLWEKAYPANEKNQVTLAMRCLLVQVNNRNILIDTGVGQKMDEKKASIYQLENIVPLDELLAQHRVAAEEITDVVLTHLHFDHCGGAVNYNTNGKPVPAFTNARYIISKKQWDAATKPNKREKASYFHENFMPIEEHCQLHLIDVDMELTPGVLLKLFHGHTEGQIIPFIQYNSKTLVYAGDLIPSAANVPLAWITAYDMQPLVALEEKESFYKEALEYGYVLFFEHDLYNECCTLMDTEKGVRVGRTFPLSEL
jgi:glyoxylase-like metal-dependent hydrolase (beta-lactamase superfamily II)